MHVGRTGRLAPEPPVQRRQQCLGQILIGPPQLADPLQPQRLDQPVLQHAIRPLHTPFGLRTVGQYQLHPQLLHRPAKLRLWPLAGQLFRHAAHPFTPVNAVPVHIQALR